MEKIGCISIGKYGYDISLSRNFEFICGGAGNHEIFVDRQHIEESPDTDKQQLNYAVALLSRVCTDNNVSHLQPSLFDDLRRWQQQNEICSNPISVKESKKKKSKSKDVVLVHPLFLRIIERFCEGYEATVGIKYTDIRKDVKELKAFLADNPAITEELFFSVVNLCLEDTFHRGNLSLRYVCSHFSTIFAKAKLNEQ